MITSGGFWLVNNGWRATDDNRNDNDDYIADNVHFMNAAQVIKALTEAEVQFKQLVSETTMNICLVSSFDLAFDIT